MDCVFCKIVSGEIPARILKETIHSVSFLDAFPLARGHVLVIPKSHHVRIQELDTKENADLFGLVRTMISGVDSISGSTLLAVHNGSGAGQEVPHVHVHLVPRSKDDHAGPIHSMFDGAVNLSESEIDNVCKLVGEQSLP
ncbi:MAG: HIT domain-containing protein [Nitrosopumilus sp. B06]|nr:MAG: HIT domain-containing protein [Nitrosopumilus sp. D6]RNJ79369.1 MAG: HIT domain-containing protein [Nitrosopumilus sp. B06]